jgi:uncharacterized membrane protein YedE/YeeE
LWEIISLVLILEWRNVRVRKMALLASAFGYFEFSRLSIGSVMVQTLIMPSFRILSK